MKLSDLLPIPSERGIMYDEEFFLLEPIIHYQISFTAIDQYCLFDQGEGNPTSIYSIFLLSIKSGLLGNWVSHLRDLAKLEALLK